MNEKRINWISSLRGIAAFMVFFSHLPFEFSFNLMFIIGRIGVVIFFLITGYLSVEARTKRNGKQYLINRFVRMYPIYWLLCILMFVVSFPHIKIKQLLLNLTMFSEFLGEDLILGASWMMPMQVCFFIFMGIAGKKLLTKYICIYKKETKFINVMAIMLSILSLCAIFTGYLRNKTGYPLPTAFFLLIAVAFIGLTYKFLEKEKNLMICLIIFETGLIPSVIMSYPDKIAAYIIAYNVGLLVFWCGDNANLNIECFNKLGEIGFTFFLGADIPYKIIEKFIDFNSSVFLIVIGSIVKLIATVIFAVVITRFVEKPLLNFVYKKITQ